MTDHSKLPQGDFVPTYASGLLLDGYDFSEDYGEGSQQARKDPQLPQSQRGLAQLPDGLLTGHTAYGEDTPDNLVETGDEAGLGDLGDLVSKTASPLLVDLSWLEMAEQDPDRLPKSPNDAVLSGLVEAWGTERRTDGVSIVPNVVVPKPWKSPTSLLPGDQLRSLAASCMRRSAYGEPLDSIARYASAQLGDSLKFAHLDPNLRKFSSVMRSIRAEHGVVGRVYLRDSAFPGLLRGKWDEPIRLKCSKSLYWLTTPGSKLSAYDNFMGKRVVTEIPWGEALSKYQPYLESSGVKVASGDPRTVLLAALSQKPAPRGQREAGVPVTAPVDTVSAEVAWRIFASSPTPEPVVVKARDDSGKIAREQISRWVSSGLLDRRDADKLLASGLNASSMVRVGAARIATAGKEVTYMGQGVGARPHVREMTKDASWAEAQTTKVNEWSVEKARKAVSSFVGSGLLTQDEGRKILASGLDAKGMIRAATARSKDTTREFVVPEVDSRAYEGTTFKAATQGRDTKRTAEWAEAETIRLAKVSEERSRATVLSLVKAGSLSERDARKIFESGLSPDQWVRVASVRAQDPYKATEVTATPVRTYADTQYTARSDVKKATVENPLEVRRLLRWASIQMNEGSTGKDLDDLLAAKWARSLLEASKDHLVQIRSKHEGLAGHLYVDASAYASPAGTTGCDRGGLVHRANSIKAVLRMDRCGSCASNVGDHCQKYGKSLVGSAPTDDPEGYQQETIRLANSSDAEHTASLFNGYKDEYGLQNDNLDYFDLNTASTNETLGGIFFDGMAIPED